MCCLKTTFLKLSTHPHLFLICSNVLPYSITPLTHFTSFRQFDLFHLKSSFQSEFLFYPFSHFSASVSFFFQGRREILPLSPLLLLLLTSERPTITLCLWWSVWTLFTKFSPWVNLTVYFFSKHSEFIEIWLEASIFDSLHIIWNSEPVVPMMFDQRKNVWSRVIVGFPMAWYSFFLF